MPTTLQAVMARVRSGDVHTRSAIRAVLNLQTNAELLVGDSIHDNGAGFRRAQLFFILAIGQEANIAFFRPPECRGGSDDDVRIATYPPVHVFG